jgi:cytochrome c553
MKKIVLMLILTVMGTLVFESCKKEKKGCTDPLAKNYDKDATENDNSCEYEKKDTSENKDTTQKGECDGTAYTYTADIKPIMDAFCVSCHQPGGGGFNFAVLNTYNGVKASATTGKMLDAINHRPGASPMPQGMAKLNAETIKKIECWVEKGAPES